MRRKSTVFAAIVIPALILVGVFGSAGAAEPPAAECSGSAVVTAMGVNVPADPGCSTGVVECPVESVGCAFSASIDMTATTGLGASRGLLRITDVDTNTHTDFYCPGPTTECKLIIPTSFQPAGRRFNATCSMTPENILVLVNVKCAAAFSPLSFE